MKQFFTIVLFSITTIAMAQNCSDLFISEYLEGSSNNKALELYNPTSSAINMSGYSVKAYNNGGVTPSNTLNLPNKTIAAGDVYLISNASAIAAILGIADTTSNITFFNGNDAVVLFKNADTLDIIGVVGFNPGTNWPVGTGATSEFTLVRKNTVQKGQKNWTIGATEWDVYPQNTTTYLGAHTSICATASSGIDNIIDYKSVDALGVADSLTKTATFQGVVYSIDFDGNAGYSFYIEDATAGINVFNFNDVDSYALTVGDKVYMTGAIAQFNGLTEFVPDSIYLVSAGNALPTVSMVTMLNESTEGEYVQLNNVSLVTPSQWPASGSSANVDVTDGTNTFLVRIDSDTDIDGSTAPTGTFSVRGAGAQFDNSSPYTSGYQLFPSSLADFIFAPATIIYPLTSVTSVNANGVVDSLNVICTIQGLVSGNNLRTNGASGVEFWLINDVNTAGLLVRNTSYAYYNVNEGDKINVHGVVNQFNGLVQFVPDSITVVSSNNILPAAAAVTALSEATDGRLVVMNNMTIVSGWPNAGSSSNVVISDGTNTFTMRADSDVYLGDSLATAPTGLVNIYGHGGQFDNSSPYTTGYQILPRYIADIQPVIVTAPTVNFSSPSQNVSEGAGAITINLPIAPTVASAQTVKVYVNKGPGITSGDYTTTPAAVGDTITLSVAAGASASFVLTIIDDVIQENAETITFTIAKVSTGLLIGSVATHAFTISDNDVFIPTYSISDLKGLDANFVPDSNNVQCKVIGTVLGVDMQGTASANVSFTIHNGTDGFGVFRANSTYIVNEGDQVRVIGKVGHFNGLAQMNADSVVFISANNPLPTPVAFTVLDEAIESQLGRFNNATIIDPTQWTNAGSGFNVDITNGTDTIIMRVDKDVVDIFNAPAPVGPFDLIGIGGQFDNSAPHNSGYQFLPRYLADIVVTPPPSYSLAITEIMANSNDPISTVNEDWWELTNYGNAAINLEGFSWDDDSEIAGTVVFPNISIPAGESFVIWRGNSADEMDFINAWGLSLANVTILSSDELTGPFPGLGSSGDAVVLYDTSATAIEICKAAYLIASAGVSIEFDTTCTLLGNAQSGTNGAYTSLGGDQGSPGNKVPTFGTTEFELQNVMVYPNPVQNTLIVEMPAGDKNISLVSITGAVVYSVKSSEAQIKINVSELPNGIYFVKLESNGQSLVKKVVKF